MATFPSQRVLKSFDVDPLCADIYHDSDVYLDSRADVMLRFELIHAVWDRLHTSLSYRTGRSGSRFAVRLRLFTARFCYR